jgi:hypothetical protein
MDVPAIIAELDDHGFADTSSTRKVAQLNATYWRICGMKPWPFLEKNVALDFDGTNAFPSNLPTDFKAVKSLWNTDGPIHFARLDTLRRAYGSDMTTVGAPVYFYFLGTQLRFYPVPPAGTATVQMDYIHRPAALTSVTTEPNIIIPFQYHRLLVTGTLVKLYSMEDDPENASVFAQEFKELMSEMYADMWQLQFDRSDQIFITDPEEYDYDATTLG